jgi:hypothetical protein
MLQYRIHENMSILSREDIYQVRLQSRVVKHDNISIISELCGSNDSSLF